MEEEREMGWERERERERQRERGWPLQLEGLNVRLWAVPERIIRSSALLLSTSSSSSQSSSDFDTQSAVSFFREKTTTLGSLMGLSSNSSSTHVAFTTNSRKSKVLHGRRRWSLGLCCLIGCTDTKQVVCPSFPNKRPRH